MGVHLGVSWGVLPRSLLGDLLMGLLEAYSLGFTKTGFTQWFNEGFSRGFTWSLLWAYFRVTLGFNWRFIWGLHTLKFP